MTERERELWESRARWIRCFNRLEKAVTNHIEQRCLDSDDLAHAHGAVMRELAPRNDQRPAG